MRLLISKKRWKKYYQNFVFGHFLVTANTFCNSMSYLSMRSTGAERCKLNCYRWRIARITVSHSTMLCLPTLLLHFLDQNEGEDENWIRPQENINFLFLQKSNDVSWIFSANFFEKNLFIPYCQLKAVGDIRVCISPSLSQSVKTFPPMKTN